MRNLQTAWEAIEKGDRVEAQSLVAQILRDDPTNAEAWMVLGEAVSGDRQILFLRKALQLNPDLAPARERLAQLETSQTDVEDDIADETTEDNEVSKSKNSLPEVPSNVSLDAPTVPIAERINAERSAPQKTVAKADETPKKRTKKSNPGNTILLVLLAIAILVVVFFLVQSLPG